LTAERSNSALSKIKSCDDIKPDKQKELDKKEDDSSDDGSFNR